MHDYKKGDLVQNEKGHVAEFDHGHEPFVVVQTEAGCAAWRMGRA